MSIHKKFFVLWILTVLVCSYTSSDISVSYIAILLYTYSHTLSLARILIYVAISTVTGLKVRNFKK